MAIERETIAQGGDEAAHGSTGRRMMRSLFRDSWTVAGAVIVAVFVFAGLFGPVWPLKTH